MESSLYGMQLPAYYGENYLRLMVQGPSIAFAYWEVSPHRLQVLAVRREQLFLRLYRDFAVPCQDVALPGLCNNWYFYNLNAGSGYRCELGIWRKWKFYPLLQSNLINIPPGTVSPNGSAKFVNLYHLGPAVSSQFDNLPAEAALYGISSWLLLRKRGDNS